MQLELGSGRHEAWCMVARGRAGESEERGARGLTRKHRTPERREGRHRLIGMHHACLVAVASPFAIPRQRSTQHGADCSGMPTSTCLYHQWSTVH